MTDYTPSSEAERIAAEEWRNEQRRDAYLMRSSRDVVSEALAELEQARLQWLEREIAAARATV